MTIEHSSVDVPEDVKAIVPEKKLRAILDAFVRIDADGDGKVAFEEYLEYVLTKERNALAKRFENADMDKDGCISLEEFVAIVEPNYPILKKFRELDLDKNGRLSLEEAISIAERLVLPLNAEQVKAILDEADLDGDGEIGYYEYLGAIAHIGFQ